MKRLAFILYTISSFLFSLTVATNLFARLLHHADILGTPQFRALYEPFHIIYWYFTVRVPGDQYKVCFVAFLASFCVFSFIGFRLYTRLRLNVQGIYGTSRWMKTRELRQDGAFKGKGIVLGQTRDARFRKNRHDRYKMLSPGKIIFDDAHTHVAVIAPTRGGKGVSCVVPTLLSWTHSVVVNDPKKENYLITSAWRNKFSHVYCFEPTSLESAKFNPLDEISPPPRDVMDAQNLSEAITHPRGDSDYDNLAQNPHWVNTAKQLISGAILYIVHEPSESDKSLHGVASFLQSPDMGMNDVLGLMLASPHPVVSETARNMLNKADEELGGVVSTACEFLSLYQDPYVAFNTSYSDFHIKDLTNLDVPLSLYICTNPESQERLRPLIRLVVGLIAKKLTSDLFVNKRPLLFLIDEFISLGKFAFIQDWLALCAQYRIKCMLIAQSFNQIYDKYGERSSLLNNCHTKAILGAGEPQDARAVVDYLGTYSVNRKNVSQSGTLGNIIARTRSNSYIETERKLMTQDEVLRLPYDDFLLLKTGKFPYRGKKLMWFSDRRFTERADPKRIRPLPAERSIRLKALPACAPLLDTYTPLDRKELIRIYQLPSPQSLKAYEARSRRTLPNKELPAAPAATEKRTWFEDPEEAIPTEFDPAPEQEQGPDHYSASDLLSKDDIAR